MNHITTYQEALDYLYQYIPNGIYKFPGDIGLERTKHLLSLLDNPQEKIKVIHIAGTSGKGSTAYLLSTLLYSQGHTVGLHISPHLLDLRERFQVNNTLITEKEFCLYLNELTPLIENMKTSPYGSPTYFEIVVTLAYYVFYKKGVDYAVIETGLGGLYDATNVVSNKNKLAIITKIGHDHTNILGNTLEKIATQKAGIIQKENTVITCTQSLAAQNVITKTAETKQNPLSILNQTVNITDLTFTHETTFTFHFLDETIPRIMLHLKGAYQVENCMLALGALTFLANRDGFPINHDTLKQCLSTAQFPGRMETFTIDTKTLIVDGAHNPQKMKAFITSLRKMYPHETFDFLLAFKKGKDYGKILDNILPIANHITITTFFNSYQGLHIGSEDPKKVAAILEKKQYKNYTIIKTNTIALEKTLHTKKKIVVTGSLYLLSEVYPLLQKQH